MKLSGPKLKGTVEIKADGSINGNGKMVAKITAPSCRTKTARRSSPSPATAA